MCIIVALLVVKTFFFLRIFPLFTPIVVMLTNVVYDLRIFLVFYFILIAFSSQLFAVLGLGNPNYDELASTGRLLKGKGGGGTREEVLVGPAKYYNGVGLHLGSFFWAFRVSLGDFHIITASNKLNTVDNLIFWLVWIMVVVVTCIVFLNFVVCEASASYNNVKESLQLVIIQAQANLIAESEDMSLKRFKNNDKFPKYYIVRKIE
jgi:hypothetical protein